MQGKLHNVALKDGTILEGMGGAMAPQMWERGEYETVLAYLKDDIRATLEAAMAAVECGRLRWLSKKGKAWSVPLMRFDNAYHFPVVSEMMTWPKPDTSWMDNPMDVDELARWTKAD